MNSLDLILPKLMLSQDLSQFETCKKTLVLFILIISDDVAVSLNMSVQESVQTLVWSNLCCLKFFC